MIANRRLAQVTISLNSDKVLTDDQTRVVLDYSYSAAAAGQNALKVLDTTSNTTLSQKIAAVDQFTRVVQLPAAVQSVAANPALQAILTELINAINQVKGAIGK